MPTTDRIAERQAVVNAIYATVDPNEIDKWQRTLRAFDARFPGLITCNRCHQVTRAAGGLLCAPCDREVTAIWNGGEYARWEWAANQ